MPLLETKGAGSAQGFGLSLGSAEAVYIEDVFSTYLYTGNSSTQTITNGIDLAGEGGLVWFKSRSAASSHYLFDTARGNNFALNSDATYGQGSGYASFFNFASTGFTLAGDVGFNGSPTTYASWTFRKQPKFFDIVTYTGNGVAGRTVAHDLGSVPGCIIVKGVSDAGQWGTYHRSLGASSSVYLNSTIASFSSGFWDNTTPTATHFSVASTFPNNSGQTYVAYLFAHNAGGFGLSGLDNVISCGSYTGDGASNGPTVNLGYEPQWILIKSASSYAGNWMLFDNMRGIPTGSADQYLNPNLSDAETTSYADFIDVTSTGFKIKTSNNDINYPGATFIYIAIRRGPMKVPTSGTQVFSPVARTGNSPTVTSITSPGFAPDAVWQKRRSPDTAASNFFDKLRGRFFLSSATTSEETAANTTATRDLVSFDNLGFTVGEQWSSELNANTKPEVYWAFQRAPGFFDEVCYTGTGVARTVAHNLAAVPELMIVKRRNAANNWAVYAAPLGNTNRVFINQTQASAADSTLWNNTTPTSSVFTVGTAFATNNSADTYVSYLFATLGGVSKVGSYTGSGTTQVINCGFTAGARFVLIKRTDDTGDWYVWDSARGIIAGNDPYLLLNSTAAEVTNTDYVDTASTGFEISSTAPAAINANGGSFIFLAIA